MTQLSTGKKLAYSLVLLAVLWLLVELACLGGLWGLQKYKGLEYTPALVRNLEPKHRGSLEAHLADTSSYMVYDPTLGWTIRPHGSKVKYRANGEGIRGDREYAPRPAPGVLRIAAFGDSFTHATGVPNGFTWEDHLERLLPGVEVMNCGVPAYGLDQAFLRYRELGVSHHPDVVFLGFMSENINRGVNTFRPFYFPQSGMPFAKPRFAVRGDDLVLLPNPMSSLSAYRELLRDPRAVIPRLGEHDFYYQRSSDRSRLDFLPSVRFAHVVGNQYLHQPTLKGGVYNTASEAYRVAVRTFDEFHREALANGSVPVVVLFPDRRDLRAHREGRSASYTPLRTELEKKGYRVLDLMDGFDRYDPEGKLVKRNFIHYPKDGNRMVAKYVRDYLVEARLDRAEGIREALTAMRAGK
jgi:hypothetical protein